MPKFGSPFSGLRSERKLSREELIRAIRFSIAAEYEAIQLYMQLAESSDDKLVSGVLRDVADEERVHAGEFLRVLKHLAPEEDKHYATGAKEVEEIMQHNMGMAEHRGGAGDLDYCRFAAAPEHERAYREEEPCDDAREGDYGKQTPGGKTP
jgi:rubrerythrin